MAVASAPTEESIKETSIRYIAQNRLRVGVDASGNVLYREVGEEVPEALTWHWRALEHMLRNRRISEVHVGSTALPEAPKRGPGRPRKEA